MQQLNLANIMRAFQRIKQESIKKNKSTKKLDVIHELSNMNEEEIKGKKTYYLDKYMSDEDEFRGNALEYLKSKTMKSMED